MSSILTTDSVEPRERLAYWVDMICETYVRLECDARPSGSFSGSIVNHQLPGLDLSLVKSRAQRVLRTPRAIANEAADFFIVSLQTKGHAVISQDGREAVMTPGDFAIYDSTRPYTLQFDDDFEEIVLKLRGDHLRSLLRDTEKLTAMKVSGQVGAGHLLISMINTLRNEIDNLMPSSAEAVAGAVVSVLVAGLQSLPPCGQVELSQMRIYHVARIKQYIDKHLQDPGLTIESVAAQVGMSVGHLHRIFKTEPLSPSQYLWNRRLEACSRELLDPRRAGASVGEIAFGWGFIDAAHFSRAFRLRFDCSPREWRRQGGNLGAVTWVSTGGRNSQR
jgi:AraC-like DNA-binding protein